MKNEELLREAFERDALDCDYDLTPEPDKLKNTLGVFYKNTRTQERWLGVKAALTYPEYSELRNQAAATRLSEAMAVIEELREALDVIHDDFVEYWYGESGKSADLLSIKRAGKALTRAEQFMKGEK